MTESFLHYIWQFQYFDKKELRTTQGEELTIFKTGFHNTHAGPDFSQAKIKIGVLDWVGNIEVHVRASEWVLHKHHHDKAYDNVVLHVVWESDKPILRSDKTEIPTLELKNKIDNSLWSLYRKLINHPGYVPCSNTLADTPFITKLSALEQALTQRLETKAKNIIASLEKNKNDWEETLYQTLGRNFGFKVNSDPFEQLTKIIPYKVILKHSDKSHQIEALLLGSGGFLDKEYDEYSTKLGKEFKILGSKYDLLKKKLHKTQWRFLRLRPANFPTIRIAQFCSLLVKQKNIFSKIIAAESVNELKQLFDVAQSGYWQTHYQMGKSAKKTISGLGDMAIENIIINTVAPILAAYSICKGEPLWMERALEFLSKLPSENNTITRQWSTLGWKATSAFDSQGMVELKNNYCNKKLCLHCTIGASLIRPSA